jgi:hypothetical protein
MNLENLVMSLATNLENLVMSLARVGEKVEKARDQKRVKVENQEMVNFLRLGKR